MFELFFFKNIGSFHYPLQRKTDLIVSLSYSNSFFRSQPVPFNGLLHRFHIHGHIEDIIREKAFILFIHGIFAVGKIIADLPRHVCMLYSAVLYPFVLVEHFLQKYGSKFGEKKSISPWAMEAMKWANAAGLITGRTETTLAPAGTATRAETAAILMRFLENVK